MIDRINNPKKRTFKQLHTLWLAALERSNKRHKSLCDCMDRIIKEIPANEHGEHIVYFDDKDGNVSRYNIKYRSEYKTYSHSWDRVNINESRQNKIMSVVRGKAFDLGNEFYYWDRTMRSYLHTIVFNKMWNEIEKWLSKNYDPKLNRDEIISIDIDGNSYLIEIDKSQSPYQTKYIWKGQNNIKNFKLE